jgi:hypothetical protein
MKWIFNGLIGRTGGRGGIRTHGTLTRTAVFKTAALNRSATRPFHMEQRITSARYGTNRDTWHPIGTGQLSLSHRRVYGLGGGCVRVPEHMAIGQERYHRRAVPKPATDCKHIQARGDQGAGVGMS